MRVKSALLDHLDELVVSHDLYQLILERLLTAIQDGARGRIIMAVGPTGVGKTCLSLDLYEKLIEFVDKNPTAGFSRPLWLEAESPDYGEFSWRTFYSQALMKMGDLGVSRKRNIDTLIKDVELGKPLRSYSYIKVYELRTYYLQALEALRPIAVLIDEAASLGKTRSHDNKGGNLNVIKSISNQRTTIQVLFGTVDARRMLVHEAQIARRVEPFPFHGYGRTETDITYFIKVLADILQELDVRAETTLFDQKQYFYAHTLGLVGVSADWIRRALERMLRRGDRVLKREHFAQTRLSNSQLGIMARDVVAFEQEFNDREDFDFEAYFRSPATREPKKPNKPDTQSRKPGRRNPKRDPTGTSSTSDAP